MTTAKRIYKIKLPLTLEEYRRGIRFAICKFTTEEVTFFKFSRDKKLNQITTESHKLLNIGERMPYVVKKVVPTAAYMVEEFSTNIDTVTVEKDNTTFTHFHQVTQAEGENHQVMGEETVIENVHTADGQEFTKTDTKQMTLPELKEIHMDCGHTTFTSYKNRHFDEKTFRMQVNTKVVKNGNYVFDDTDAKVEEIDFRIVGKEKLEKVADRDYSGDYSEKFPCIYVYKHIEIEINQFGIGWVSKEVLKILRDNIAELQQDVVRHYSEWSKMTEEELDEYENKTIEKFNEKNKK